MAISAYFTQAGSAFHRWRATGGASRGTVVTVRVFGHFANEVAHDRLRRRRYLIRCTVWMSLAWVATFLPFFLSALPFSFRLGAGIMLCTLMSLAGGYIFGVLTWKPVSRWLGRQ